MTDASVPDGYREEARAIALAADEPEAVAQAIVDLMQRERDALRAEIERLRGELAKALADCDEEHALAITFEQEGRADERRRIEAEIVGPLLDTWNRRMQGGRIDPFEDARSRAERWRAEVKREQGGK